MSFLKMALPLLALSLSTSTQVLAQNAAAEKLFPFVLPWNDASKTAVDVSALNPAPLDETRRLRVEDGRFRDATGRRVRFLGVNVGAGDCFPARPDAVQVARRMRKFGINIVRLHHMDAMWASPNIFSIEGNTYNKPTTELSAESLERLDFFVAQLKENGIYVNINLHVSRPWGAADGFPNADKLEGHGKIVSYFEPRAIELQKQFATQLLSHVNPYTRQSYAADPAVALVEMTNEDSLLGSSDSTRGLPEHYQNILRRRWNGWLTQKYGSNDGLLATWNREAVPLGAQVLASRFEDGNGGWAVETHEGTAAEISTESAAGATNAPEGRVLRLRPTKINAEGWHLQLNRTGLNLKDGQLYTLSFAARASEARAIGVNVRLDQAPWRMLGLDTTAALEPFWKRYSFSFRALAPVADHARISIVAGNNSAEVFLGDVTLQEGGGGVDLAGGQSLENNSVALATLGDTPVGRDWAAFLMDVEADYTAQMKAAIRETGSRAPLLCSQASYGGLGGVWRESNLDVVDMHAYWQHPNFPNRAWDTNDYRIGNSAMTRAEGGGALSGVGMHRVAGQPFIVTEYDHPAPNEYAAETVPMLLATAAWQDWDGVFLFSYGSTNGGTTQNPRDKITGFFDVDAHPAKWAFLPTMAQVWLRGYLSPAPQTQVLAIPTTQVAPLVAARTEYGFWQAALGQGAISNFDIWSRRSSLRFDATITAPALAREERALAKGDTSRLEWRPQDGVWSFSAPGTFGAVGFIGGKTSQSTEASFEVAPNARNFAALTLAAMDGKPLIYSRSLLLTAVDKAENPGLEWNAERSAAGRSWESGPVQVVGVGARVSLWSSARTARVWALDPTGARKKEVPAQIKDGRLSFSISPTDQTVWYEIAPQ